MDDIFDYLHDAAVDRFEYTFAADGTRNIVLAVTCHDDSGSAAWNGARAAIELHDVCRDGLSSAFGGAGGVAVAARGV